VEGATVPEDLRIHDLRHTCAALLIAQGDHPKAIQAHLGHSSIQVIELRSEREYLRAVIEPPDLSSNSSRQSWRSGTS
jgi:integrase